MNKKRGMLLVLVLFMLVCSFVVFAEEDSISLKKFEQFDLGDWDVDDSDTADNIGDSNDHDRDAVAKGEEESRKYPEREGCRVYACEEDYGVGYNDCGDILTYAGLIVDVKRTENTFLNKYGFHHYTHDETDFLRAIKGANIASSDLNAYICADEGYWYQCTNEIVENGGKLIHVNTAFLGGVTNTLFNCTLSLNPIGGTYYPEWREIGVDYDLDNFPEQEDCKDNDGSSTSCLYITKEDCGNVEYSTCAVCINPDAPEICGDGINNDCGGMIDGEQQNEPLNELTGNTPDACDKNRDSCTSGNNVLGIELPWISKESTVGYCCGYHGDEDHGLIIEDSPEGGVICINTSVSGKEGEDYGENCASDWCALNVIDSDFEIISILKKDKIYDVVSNGDNWYECNFETVGPLENPSSAGDELIIPSNKFYCFQEGDHYSWAECNYDSESANSVNKNVKGRYVGEGLYTLPLGDVETREALQTGVNLNIKSEFYENYYGSEYKELYEKEYLFDFTGYDLLNFMFTFLDEGGEGIGYEDRVFKQNLPVQLKLEVQYEDETEFSKDVLNYISNNPLFEKGKYMHVEIDLEDFFSGHSKTNINQINIKTAGTVSIAVRNVYLSKEQNSENRICSGRSSPIEGESSWIDDIDSGEVGKRINGQFICQGLFGAESWLGDDEIVAEEGANCCGDDADEYYAKESISYDGSHYGCWNSQPIKHGNTTMNVEITFKLENNGFVTKEYTCNTEECVYPVPENTKVITNPHKQLYELYYIYRDDSGNIQQQLIENDLDLQSLNYGNVIAKKVSQQIIFENILDEEQNPLRGFYGCNAAEFVINIFGADNIIENLNYCQVKSGRFCAPSVEHVLEDNNRYNTINSWSGKTINQIAYDYDEFELPDEFNDENYFESLILPLKNIDPAFTAEELSNSANIIPGRNILSNAEFKVSNNEIPHWELFKDGTLLEREYVDGGIITLESTADVLRSERIAIKTGMILSFSQEQECSNTEIHFVDKEGNDETAITTDFNNFEISENYGDVSFIYLQFQGPCSVEKPLLQLMDDNPKADFYYQENNPDGFNARTATACCPENYCWNGYACVEPMTTAKTSQFFEYVPNDRYYRCINGKWSSSPVRWDWINENKGFCNNKEQCFVWEEGKELENLRLFYDENQFPRCIDDQEYLLDNYCNAGKWISRTSLLASKMINIANEGYSLYCTNYRDALITVTDAEEQYLGGDSTVEITSSSLFGQETEQIKTCFSGLSSGEKENLVSDEKNTCINKVCILKKGNDVAFGTTLNVPLTSQNSFLRSLGIVASEENCLNQEDDYVECTFDNTFTDHLWYNEKIESIIYTKSGSDITMSNLWDNLVDWFKNLFGIEESESPEALFVNELSNYDDFYMLSKDGKKIRAAKLYHSYENQKLIIEYEGFKTDVCRYIDVYVHSAQIAENDPLVVAGNIDKIKCVVEEGIQKVEATTAVNELWPELTGKLRVD